MNYEAPLQKKKRQEMEGALNKAKQADQAAANTKGEEDKLKYYEYAKVYREEAERKRDFLQEFMNDIDDSVQELTESVQEKTKNIDVNDVFGIDEPEGNVNILDVDDKEIKVKQSKRSIKLRKKKRLKY